MKTNKGRVKDKDFEALVKDGCVSMIDGKIIVDNTLYQDIYWNLMKNSPDRENRKNYEENYEQSLVYREDWLQTEHGIAWKKRHGFNVQSPTPMIRDKEAEG